MAPGRDPSFRAAVVGRLGARRGTWTAYARAHAGILAMGFAVALAVGGWAGTEQARLQVARDRAEIAAMYVKTYDARMMDMP